MFVTGGEGARSVRRPAASFKVRRRSLSPKRQAEFDQWIARWGLDLDGPDLDWTVVFGRDGDVVLDIGFGHGESTIEMAAAEPDLDVIGVEVHTPGVVTVLDAIEHCGLDHIRVVHGDLLPFLDRIAPESLAAIRIYFPDPWPKKRHHKRRIIQPEFLDLLSTRIRPGGLLHLATDWQPYAEHMLEVLSAHAAFQNCSGINRYSDKPDWRPDTKYEARGARLGHRSFDLIFCVRANPADAGNQSSAH